MKFLRKFNESLNKSEFEEAFLIQTEDLPFTIDKLKITERQIGGYYVTFNIVVEPELKRLVKVNRQNDFEGDSRIRSLNYNDLNMVLYRQLNPLFSRFAKKYDLEYNPKTSLDIDIRADRFDSKPIDRLVGVDIDPKWATNIAMIQGGRVYVNDFDLDINIELHFAELGKKDFNPYDIQVNESFNNETELEEALEIFEEDLPFQISDDWVEVKTTEEKVVRYDSTGVQLEVMSHSIKMYIIHYTHLDDSLNNLIPLPHKPGIFEEDPDDIETPFDLTKVRNKVTNDINTAFAKFAKKYDLIYENDQTIIDVDFDDDNAPLDWDSVEDVDELNLVVLVRVILKQLL